MPNSNVFFWAAIGKVKISENKIIVILFIFLHFLIYCKFKTVNSMMENIFFILEVMKHIPTRNVGSFDQVRERYGRIAFFQK